MILQPTHKNVAVFRGTTRLFRNVNAFIGNGKVVVMNPVSGATNAEFVVDEVVKLGEAWDAHQVGVDTVPFRLVIQSGCGCSGQRAYKPDPEYLAAHPAT
jgi:hypothetical protein